MRTDDRQITLLVVERQEARYTDQERTTCLCCGRTTSTNPNGSIYSQTGIAYEGEDDVMVQPTGFYSSNVPGEVSASMLHGPNKCPVVLCSEPYSDYHGPRYENNGLVMRTLRAVCHSCQRTPARALLTVLRQFQTDQDVRDALAVAVDLCAQKGL